MRDGEIVTMEIGAAHWEQPPATLDGGYDCRADR
jgi:hypothetical protein